MHEQTTKELVYALELLIGSPLKGLARLRLYDLGTSAIGLASPRVPTSLNRASPRVQKVGTEST